jgi:hypothetical protein
MNSVSPSMTPSMMALSQSFMPNLRYRSKLAPARAGSSYSAMRRRLMLWAMARKTGFRSAEVAGW